MGQRPRDGGYRRHNGYRDREAVRLLDGVSTFRGPLLGATRRRRTGVPVSLQEWIGFYAIVAGAEIERRYAHTTRELGISLRDFVVLAEARRRPGIGQTALSQRLGISRSRLSEQLAVLDLAGYIEREMNVLDLRRRRIWVAAPGMEVLEEAHEALDRMDRAWLGALERRERIRLKAALRRLAPAEDEL